MDAFKALLSWGNTNYEAGKCLVVFIIYLYEYQHLQTLDERKAKLAHLMQYIRFPLIRPRDLYTIIEQEVLFFIYYLIDLFMSNK